MSPTPAKWRAELAAMIALAVPVVLSELGWVAQGVVDNIMVGRLGPVAIGAVALGNAVFILLRCLGSGCCWGWTHWWRRLTGGAITMSVTAGWRKVFIWHASLRRRFSFCCGRRATGSRDLG